AISRHLLIADTVADGTASTVTTPWFTVEWKMVEQNEGRQNPNLQGPAREGATVLAHLKRAVSSADPRIQASAALALRQLILIGASKLQGHQQNHRRRRNEQGRDRGQHGVQLESNLVKHLLRQRRVESADEDGHDNLVERRDERKQGARDHSRPDL